MSLPICLGFSGLVLRIFKEMSVKAIFDYTVSVAIVASLIGGLAFAFSTSLGIPDVHYSHSTGECVKVINYEQGDNYSCENVPSKFNHVWVE